MFNFMFNQLRKHYKFNCYGLKMFNFMFNQLRKHYKFNCKIITYNIYNHILPKYYSQIVQYYEMCKHAIYTRVQTNSSYVYISK